MSIIDKGVDPALFVSKGKRGSNYLTLKLGMLALGVSLGILTALFITETFEDIPGEPVVLSMILLFGGGSLIANYLVERKIDSESKEGKEQE